MNRRCVLLVSVLVALTGTVSAWQTQVVNGISWTYEIGNGEACVGTGSPNFIAIPTNTTGAISIPSKLGGCPVTVIRDYAFQYCQKITSIDIPDGVRSIGKNAFFADTVLTSVTIPDSVTSIGDRAFGLCRKLESVSIPPNLTRIEAWVFEGCERLTSITIPSGVTFIGEYAFAGDDALTSIAVPDSVTTVGEYAFPSSSGRLNAIYNQSGTTLWHVNTTLSGRFSVPDGVKTIGDFAMSHCMELTAISIPASVTSIGYCAFFFDDWEESKLTEVHISDLAAWCGINFPFASNPCRVAHHLFLNGEEITNLVIPDGVTNVNGFSGCSSLTSVSIPDGVTGIGSSAFSDCSRLSSVSIPNGATSIGDNAFNGCSRLMSISIPDSMSCVGRCAFDGCPESLFDTTTIPGVQLVDGWVIGPDSEVLGSLSGRCPLYLFGIRGIASFAFEHNRNPSSGEPNQYAYPDLDPVVIPGNVPSVPYRAFTDLLKLGTVQIGFGVKSIEKLAFGGCSYLTAVSIPGSVTNIGESAFGGCLILPSIVIPNSVKSIGDGAFENCWDLTSITFSGDMTSLGDRVFRGCYKLRDVNIPNGVENIGEDAFFECSLGSVTIPDSVTNIGASAFFNAGMTSIAIPSSVKSIGALAFAECGSMKTVSISDGVTSIGEKAFATCGGLTSIAIPDSVMSIGDDAFEGCSRLTTLELPIRFEGHTSSMGIPDGCNVVFFDSRPVLRVRTDHGPSIPAPGTHALEVRSNMVCSVSSPVPDPVDPDIQYVSIGWRGTGSVPATGTEPIASFPIFRHSTIDWLWRTNIWTECSVSGEAEAGSVAGWRVFGGENCIVPFNPGSAFFGWKLEGDTAGVTVDAAARTIAIPSDGPHRVSARFVSAETAVGTGGKPVAWNAGSAQWRPAFVDGASGGACLRTEATAANAASAVSATVSGNGTFSFRWKISAGRGDTCTFYVDGAQAESITRSTSWATVSVDFNGGTHMLEWVYVRGSGSASGEDAAFLDDFDWRPETELFVRSNFGTADPAPGTQVLRYGDLVSARVSEPAATAGTRHVCTGWTGTGSVPASGMGTAVSFVVTNDSSLVWNWRTDYRISLTVEGSATADFSTSWLEAGTVLVIHWSPTSPYFVASLSGDTENTSFDEVSGILEIPVDRPRSILLSVRRLTLAGALDSAGVPWSTDGAAPWFPQVETSEDGEDSARSGSVLGDETSSVLTTLDGPGTLSWSWRIDSTGNAGVDVFLDELWLDSLAPGPEWSRETVEIGGTGIHEIRFEFWNAGTETGRGDCAYLDRVSWSGEVPGGRITVESEIPVPFAWLDEYSLVSGNDYETSADATAANGENKVWECYMAGLDPTNAAAKFLAGIVFDEQGFPAVVWTPDLGEARDYAVDGKENLSDEWGLQDENSRFFRVRVAMPHGFGSHTIAFETDGADAIEPISADYGAAVIPPADPTKNGYSFVGWSPVFPDTMPARDLTLVALWAPKKYSITFDGAGGSSVEPIVADYGVTIAAPVDPTRDGYDFLEWDPVFPATMPLGGTTLVARWTPRQYSISFDTNGGNEIAPIAADCGTELAAPANPTKDGYDFAGWSPEFPNTMPANGTTLVAQWTPRQYSISFDTGGGSTIEPITEACGSAVTAPADPRRDGYDFAGWSPAFPATMPTGGATLVAQWRYSSELLANALNPGLAFTTDDDVNWFVVADETHDGVSAARNGNLSPGQDSWIQTTVWGPGTLSFWWKVSSYPCLDYLRFTIDGLQHDAISGNTDGWSQRSFSIKGKGEHILRWSYPKIDYVFLGSDCGWLDEVVWTPDVYMLRFEANGGTGSMSDVEYDPDDTTVTLPVCGFSRPGWTFAGWARSAAGAVEWTDGETAANGFADLAPGGDVTLFARWSQESYVVRFNENGGTGTMPDATLWRDLPQALPFNKFSKEGSQFVGWAMEPDGEIILGNGEIVSYLPSGTTLYAIWWSGTFEYEVAANGTAVITGASEPPPGFLSIPPRLDGRVVSGIGDGAFYWTPSLTSITIPACVTTIGYQAFGYCSKLRNVTVLGNPELAANCAFYGCTSVESVAFAGETSIKSIFPDAYTNIVSVSVLEGSTNIVRAAFAYCYNLKSVTIPNSIKSIGNSAFTSCRALSSISIPLGVTNIDDFAFQGCSGLTSIIIPNSVTNIGRWTFYACDSLTSISIPDSVTSIGDYAFRGCSGLTSITIPNGVTSIGSNAFDGCWELKDVVFPGHFRLSEIFPSSYTTITNAVIEGVTSIEYGAFRGCSGLTSISIPDSVTSIEEYAFEGCSGLASFRIPDGVTSIGSAAFRGCSGLTSITIPDGVTSIGSYAFFNCSGLTSITIPNSVTSIGNYAFCGCSGLTEVTIPNSVTSIGSEAFRGCSGLTSITIPNSVTSIEEYAFYGCSGLTSITIPDGVTRIGSEAFEGCSGLTSITIPDSVTRIGSGAFFNCSGLTSITIPNSVTSIGSNPFYGCSNLSTLSLPSRFKGNSSILVGIPDGCEVVWTPDVYTLRFDANGGTGGMDDMEEIACGASVTLPTCGFSRPGWTFVGWARSADGAVEWSDGETVANGFTSLASGGKATLFARWSRGTYTVRFDANGGSGAMNDATMWVGLPQALPRNAFTQDGPYFVGWATEEGGEAVYADGASVLNLAPVGESVTLWAVWSNKAEANVGSWTTGIWTDGNGSGTDFTAVAANRNLARRSGTAFTTTSKTRSEPYYDVVLNNTSVLFDGMVGGGSDQDKAARCAIDSRSVLTWDFGTSCTLDEIRVYNIWNDNGRDQIAIDSVEVQLAGDEGTWHSVSVSSVSCQDPAANSSSPGRPFAFLAMPDGTPLAVGATALRMTWDDVENGWVGCAEIELVGREYCHWFECE